MLNEMTIYNSTYQVANQDLRKNIKVMMETITGINKNTWKYAIACYNIISQELYKEDFKNVSKFAKALDVNSSMLTKYHNGVEFYLNELQKDYSMEMLTVGKCYVLSTIENFKDFKKWAKNPPIEKLTQRQLEELIKKYNSMLSGEEVEEAVSTETESTEENYTELEAVLVNDDVIIKVNSKTYIISLEDLKEFEAV